jgi:mannan polymerase II complex ANP1 subunit
MAKRMKFSVVGLPHYTIWHLYEPSVDDIRHMEEMEKERKEKAEKEKEEKARMEKIKAQFESPEDQWLKDKADIRNMAKEEYAKREQEKGPKGDTAKSSNKVVEKPVSGPGELKIETKNGRARILDPLDEIKVLGK